MSGTQLKLRGIDRVASHNQQWMRDAARWLQDFIDDGREFTSDDVRESFWIATAPHPNAYGALFNTLARQGKIRRIGYRPSTLPSTHGRIVSVWEGVR